MVPFVLTIAPPSQGLSMLPTISSLISNWLHGFVLDTEMLLPAVLSSVLASTAIVAFIVFSSQWSKFCFVGHRRKPETSLVFRHGVRSATATGNGMRNLKPLPKDPTYVLHVGIPVKPIGIPN
jgi:hypothetical protein